MSRVLEDKRTATRLRVLVEITDRQPAVSQGEIADAVGVTSQAVSEYIRGLVEDGLVEKEGRSRYRTTKEGVDWLFREAKSIRQFADRVTEEVLDSVQEDTALATAPIEPDDTVTLSIRDGLLHATPGDEGPATGVATTAAEADQDVSITGFEGVIEMSPGIVTICQVPRSRNGGSRGVDVGELAASVEAADLVVAAGVEAVAALRRIDVDPAVHVGAGAVAAEAATKGQDVAVVASVDEAGGVVDVLRDKDVTYDLESVERTGDDAETVGER
jgi:putative transcriptional regulator